LGATYMLNHKFPAEYNPGIWNFRVLHLSAFAQAGFLCSCCRVKLTSDVTYSVHAFTSFTSLCSCSTFTPLIIRTCFCLPPPDCALFENRGVLMDFYSSQNKVDKVHINNFFFFGVLRLTM
jgi:hypothetical protein